MPATRKRAVRKRAPARTRTTKRTTSTRRRTSTRRTTPRPKSRSRARPTRQQTITLPGGFKVRVNRGNLILDGLKRSLHLPGGMKLPW